MARRKRIPYDPPGTRGKQRRRASIKTDKLFMTRRMFIARGAVVSAFSVLAARLGYLQLAQRETYQAKASANIRGYVTTKSNRGMIYDRVGRELARNERAWEVRIDPAKLPAEGTPEREMVLEQLVNALDIPDALILNPRDVPKGDEPMVYAKTAQLLGKATLGVEETDRTVRHDGILEPTGDVLLVNGQQLEVFAYPTVEDRATEASRINLDGTLYDGEIVDWGGRPSFFSVGNLLTILLCEDAATIASTKRAIARLPMNASTLTTIAVAQQLRGAGLASWTEYIEQEAKLSTLVRLEDELTPDQAAMFRSRLHELPGVKVISQLEYRIANAPIGRKVVVKTGVTREIALKLEANALYLPGVELDGNVLVRHYPGGESMSHILGYAGKISEAERAADENQNDAGNPIYELDDTIGKDGIERVLETKLRGERGGRWVEIDASGAERQTLKTLDPIPGQNVKLTIDLEFQRAVAEILRLGIEFSNADRYAIGAREPDKAIKKESGAGSVVAIDPRNGEVLAMVSYPHYDNQLFVDGISTRKFKEYNDKARNQPLLDRALRGAYPPGSTLKPFLAAIALDQGTITLDTSYTCTGAIRVPFAWDESKGNFHPCWSRDGHQAVDVLTAIELSCDIFFYNVGAPKDRVDPNDPTSTFLHYRDIFPNDELGDRHDFEGLGIERMKKHLEGDFVFGKKTGIDLPAEEPGVVPNNAWRQLNYPGQGWSVGDTINTSIGQGFFLTTPLQMALNTSALANHGTIYQPRLWQEIHDDKREQVETSKPKVTSKLSLKRDHIDTARTGMRMVVENPERTPYESLSGQKRWPLTNPLDQDEIPIAGKTGTAEVGLQDETTLRYESQHAWFTCFAPYEEPEIALAVIVEDGGEGATYAVPIADRVVRAYLELTGKRPRGKVLLPEGTTDPSGSVLAPTAAFPAPGGNRAEAVD